MQESRCVFVSVLPNLFVVRDLIVLATAFSAEEYKILCDTFSIVLYFLGIDTVINTSDSWKIYHEKTFSNH